MSVLTAADGYRLWAPRYAAETAVSRLEDDVVGDLGIDTEATRLLDVGCGTARRLCHSGAAIGVGVDLSPAMLAEAIGPCTLAAGDARALPFAAGFFDVVWCRLVIGHVAGLHAVYAELGRVCRRGGTVVVTDFHPDAVAAGHRRTFPDRRGISHEIEHHVHDPLAHVIAAGDAGLLLVERRDAEVSPAIRPFYERAGRLADYEAQCGLCLVLALVFRSR